ncbi:MAG: lipopolysaccharide assembly protein LapA domain-containing protein [Candidatus Devosia phytovorans]|uniref:Lipopolysaccharide assembly protein LapA domain-containing protein n=1 Tax=Candidatus Devosia phytovorans TaxID=3121372 RepID=A0AAJ5VTT8_9HYPH|nr:lipopolysaccharide assembly protein LapA domain-containing protein [Devosia sp.]WEK04075.1 MAG: lipopolysaccharide assembly protein LapA domain-containing protein [Devosia sp.]
MVNKIVGWVVLVPLCLGLIIFALANRHFVAVNFNPFVSADSAVAPGYGVPLFVVMFVILLLGVLLGGIATWFSQAGHRRSEKHWRREARQLSSELESLRRKHGQAPNGRPAEADDLLELR